MGVGGQRKVPIAFTPGKYNQYPLYRKLGGPPGWSRQVRKISHSTGIWFANRPALASRYNDWAILAQYMSDDTVPNSVTQDKLLSFMFKIKMAKPQLPKLVANICCLVCDNINQLSNALSLCHFVYSSILKSNYISRYKPKGLSL
jgi:DMSO reductase anchor subunit